MADDSGRRHGAVVSFHDVTERVRTEIELRQAKIQAESASKSKSDFLANISHEIRTPMTAVLGYADKLLTPSLSGEERRRSIQIIRRNVRLLMTLIDDILDISKIEAGRYDIVRSITSLQEIVSEVYSLLSCRAQEKNFPLIIEFEGDLPPRIFTAPVRLRQILINIIGNAIKFTDEGEVRVIVRCHFQNRENKPVLEFEIRDTGIGIPKTAVDKLFSPFVQVDTTTTRQYGGTGLGLVISKRLANELGGDVVLFQNREGVGSTFVVTIDPGPVIKNEFVSGMKMKDVLDSPSELGQIEPHELQGLKVLVVEDSIENRDLIASYLETAGAVVRKANDGLEGVERASREFFDAIVMDIQMPRMDGYQAVATLRERGYSGAIMALTAHAMPEDKALCGTAGFDDYLTKPVDVKRLIEVIKTLASRSMIDKSRILNASSEIRAIFGRFVKNIPDEVSEIRKGVENQDWDGVVRLAHRFRGTAENCGFKGLGVSALQLEDAVLDGKKENIKEYVEKLEMLSALSIREFQELEG
jgi:CheY-like chemotaxis protein/nitrogen-specific signal transduction histidine kinase